MDHLRENAPLPEKSFHERRQEAVLGVDLYGDDLHKAIGAFFHGEGVIGVDGGGLYRILVRDSDTEELASVGEGPSIEAALEKSLKSLYEHETIKTEAIAKMQMTETGSVSFTRIEDYSPRVAPSKRSRPIPSYIGDLLGSDFAVTAGNLGSGEEMMSKEEAWELRGLIDSYCAADPDGSRLAEYLKIHSLSHLTPAQAIQLSAGITRSVFRYDYDSYKDWKAGKGRPWLRADTMTSTALLAEAIEHKYDPQRKGTVFCGHIARANQDIVEALKATQADLSMLRDTYCLKVTGYEGEGYQDSRKFSRENFSKRNSKHLIGHAWNMAVTIGEGDSGVVTIFDATWALDNPDRQIDYTEARSIAPLVRLFRESETKAKAFEDLSRFVDDAFRIFDDDHRLDDARYKSMREHLISEYLGVAWRFLSQYRGSLPDTFVMPRDLISNMRMITNPQHHEVEALFALNGAWEGFERRQMHKIIASLHEGMRERYGDGLVAATLLFDDPALQSIALEAIGDERSRELAAVNDEFRARAAESRPKRIRPQATIKKFGGMVRQLYGK